MNQKPNTADPAKPRRGLFQFRLRTLLIVVMALLAIPMAYVGWQAKIVRERKAWSEAHPGIVMYLDDESFADEQPPKDPLPLIRRRLGDRRAEYVRKSDR
jgi:hypothetical protein